MLEATEISVKAGDALLLDRVSLSVGPGELVAVLGPNGAGKSTLLKTLAGEIKLTSGSVSLHGKPLTKWPLKALGRARAVLPQQSRISFSLTAMEVATYGRFPHCDGNFSERDRNIARLMLDKMDVLHLAERDFSGLSGGEQHRVQLARVLTQIDGADTMQSRYLLLDEPTAALDLPHQHHLLRQARQLAEENRIGVLVILHDLNLAARYAHRMVYLKNGRKLVEGSVEEMMDTEKIAACFDMATTIIAHPTDRCPMMIV